ncbi:hypothetical protein [Sporosarcina sp. G11-34]|uniref:hypothetical protein n=1 Tax=Sporosarcina sp. G11-34 TaxID=2849605 RepID=UPI0022A9A766|nr:hypothetical protein [Sporosarcina sp. G11-34]MCZ2260786.1 hypothetical protein [Sporosarcina sp. G11-34]
MNEKIAMLDRYLISQNSRLESGEILSVKLKDGVLTIFKELDEETGKKKTVTLIEEFDAKLDLTIDDLIPNKEELV